MATVLRASGKPQVGRLVWNVPEVLCVRQLKLREERRSFFFLTGEYRMRLNFKPQNLDARLR